MMLCPSDPGRKAIGPMCCVTHVKEPSALIEKRRGFAPVFLAGLAAYCATHLVNYYMVLCMNFADEFSMKHSQYFCKVCLRFIENSFAKLLFYQPGEFFS